MHILCLSNGHGEDIIAVNILQAFQQLSNPPKISALPIVGEGQAFLRSGIPITGPVQSMPSGGFIYMDHRQLIRDLNGGLLQLTCAQYQAVRSLVKEGAKIIAVGDIVPMTLAWLSRGDYVFVGTAKSEYYWRDMDGQLLPGMGEWGWNGSIYLPWERWLMRRSHCRGVFPRDGMTAKALLDQGVKAFDLGNPMMDGIESSRSLFYDRINELQEVHRALKITLLPGSREPEAQRNWCKILEAIDSLLALPRKIICYAALAPSINIKDISQNLQSHGWQLMTTGENEDLQWQKNQATIILSKEKYSDFLHSGDIAIAMAGTATEQFVGLGKPAFIMPGEGPQFTLSFAYTQQTLLGESIIFVEQPSLMINSVMELLQEPDRLQSIVFNGKKRMGDPGASARIAATVMELFQ